MANLQSSGVPLLTTSDTTASGLRRRFQNAENACNDNADRSSSYRKADYTGEGSAEGHGEMLEGDDKDVEDVEDAEVVRQQLLGKWLGQLGPSSVPLTDPANIPLPESPTVSRPPTPDTSSNVPCCRICFSGPAGEDEPELGRMITPCTCRGTMAHIHTGCLQRYRRSAANGRSFWKCDICGYKYRIRRVGVAGLADNKIALGCTTFFFFWLLVMVAGYIARRIVDARTWPILDPDESWGSFGLHLYTYDGRLISDAIGEAVRILNSRFPVDLESLAADVGVDRLQGVTPTPERGGELTTHRYRRLRNPPCDPRSQTAFGSSGATNGYCTGRCQALLRYLPPQVLSKLQAWIQHSILGLALIGIVSIGRLIISLALFPPLGLGVRNSVFSLIRGNRRDRDAAGIGSGIILLLVVAGVLKAIHSVWKAVRWLSQFVLRYVEERVLDVRE